MTTAVDSNVIIDLIQPDSARGDASERALNQALAAGSVILCDIVLAEIAPWFEDSEALGRFMVSTGIDVVPSSTAALHRAGIAWRQYASRRPRALECGSCAALTSPACASCGASLNVRQHMVADFVVGAHALHHADRLLTHDARYYTTYFPELRLGL